MPEAAPWCLYLLECRNGAYYAGITNRLEARYAAHLAGTGAKYTRANPPVRVLASRGYPDRSAASRAAVHRAIPKVITTKAWTPTPGRRDQIG